VTLSDVFAYFYEADLATLNQIISEAGRIRAEREQDANPAAVGGASLLPGRHFTNAIAGRLNRLQILSVKPQLSRRRQDNGTKKKARPDVLGSVSLGAEFIYRTAEIMGPEYADARQPPFEEQLLKVVGFKPRYVNQIVVQGPSGTQSLLPLWMVEKALRLQTSTSVEQMSVEKQS